MATPRADEIVQLKAELAVLKEREQSEGNPTLKSELNRRIIETHRTMNLLLETQQVSFHQHHVVLLTRIKGAEPAVFYFASQATAEFVRATAGIVSPVVKPWFRRAGRARDLAHAGGSNTTTADKDTEPLMNQVMD